MTTSLAIVLRPKSGIDSPDFAYIRRMTNSRSAPSSQPLSEPVRLTFKPVDGARPADAIQAQVRAMIASHRLKTGDRLPTERELAEQLGVSRNSVRQAIRSLADSGLLEVKKGAAGGAFIRDGGAAAIRASLMDMYSLGSIQPAHLIETRLLIGVEVVRLACERGTEEDLDELERNVKEAEEAVKAGDVNRRTVINLEFYRILARMTGNPLLEIVTDAVMAITQRYAEAVMRTSNAAVMPFRRKILADLRARDAAAAEERMREHLLKLQKIYLTKANPRDRPATPS